MTALLAVLLGQLGGVGGNLSPSTPLQLLDEGVRQGSVGELNCTGAGVTCTRSGARGTLNVTGGGSGGGPPVDAGYVVWGANSTGSTNERAITSGTNTTVDVGTTGQVKVNLSGTVPQTLGGTGAGALTCTSGQALTSNGTAQACTSTLTANAYSGTLGQANGGLGAASLTCGAGDYVTCNGTVCSCSTPAGGSGYATVQDEGTPLTARTTLNFAGAGVTCADDTTRTTCTIPGAAGGGTSPLILSFGGF